VVELTAGWFQSSASRSHFAAKTERGALVFRRRISSELDVVGVVIVAVIVFLVPLESCVGRLAALLGSQCHIKDNN